MKRFSPTRTVASLFALIATFATTAQAQYTNGQSASIVLGQPSFTSGGAANPPTQSSLNSPTGVISDPVTGKLFVVDTANNRILRFSSAAAQASGTVAEFVFGQANFTTKATGFTATALNGPKGAVLDSSGNLWVADASNNRVVRFSGATTTFTASPTADLVLGQTGFVAPVGATSQIGMNGPNSVAFDSNGSLFVADLNNNRVLRFDNASSLANGAPANGVLGQNNYLSAASGITASTFNVPNGIAVDAEGNLWVADFSNNRVLRFNSAASAANGAAANAVLGQVNFVSSSSGTTQTTLWGPAAVGLDSVGRLYVSDINNNRVLIYQSPLTKSNGGAANFVLGQTNFTTGTAGLSATTFNRPYGMSFANGDLWVADSNATNSRALSFAITAGTPAITSSPTKPKLKSGKTKSFKVFVSNSVSASDVFSVGAFISSASKKKTKSVSFSYAGTDITSDLLAGTFSTPEISAGQPVQITVKVTARSASQGGKGAFTITFTAASETLSSKSTSLSVKSTIQTP